jgi:hypothetical protein
MKWGEQMEPRQETPVVENKVLSPAEVKNIIEELTRQNSRMAIIQQIAKRINVEMSYDDIIDEVAAPLRSVLPYDLPGKGKQVLDNTLASLPAGLDILQQF